jgi:hypothetical protein
MNGAEEVGFIDRKRLRKAESGNKSRVVLSKFLSL